MERGFKMTFALIVFGVMTAAIARADDATLFEGDDSGESLPVLVDRAEGAAKTAKARAEASERISTRDNERATQTERAARAEIEKWNAMEHQYRVRQQEAEDAIQRAHARQLKAQEDVSNANAAVAQAHEALEQAVAAKDEAEAQADRTQSEAKDVSLELTEVDTEQEKPDRKVASAPHGAGSWQTVSRECNLRRTASTSAPVVGKLVHGDRVQIKSAAAKWLKVKTIDGDSGYLATFCTQ